MRQTPIGTHGQANFIAPIHRSRSIDKLTIVFAVVGVSLMLCGAISLIDHVREEISDTHDHHEARGHTTDSWFSSLWTPTSATEEQFPSTKGDSHQEGERHLSRSLLEWAWLPWSWKARMISRHQSQSMEILNPSTPASAIELLHQILRKFPQLATVAFGSIKPQMIFVNAVDTPEQDPQLYATEPPAQCDAITPDQADRDDSTCKFPDVCGPSLSERAIDWHRQFLLSIPIVQKCLDVAPPMWHAAMDYLRWFWSLMEREVLYWVKVTGLQPYIGLSYFRSQQGVLDYDLFPTMVNLFVSGCVMAIGCVMVGTFYLSFRQVGRTILAGYVFLCRPTDKSELPELLVLLFVFGPPFLFFLLARAPVGFVVLTVPCSIPALMVIVAVAERMGIRLE